MRQVVSYKSLKTMENHQHAVRPKKCSRSLTGGGRLIEVLACSRLSDSGEDAKVKGTRGSNCKALTGNVLVF